MPDFSVDRAMRKARTHERKGEQAKAQEVYRDILKRFPNNVRAQAALRDGKGTPASSAAARPAARPVAASPAPAGQQPLPQAAVDRLMKVYRSGDFKKTAELAREMLREYPQSYFIWNMLGAACTALSQNGQAIEAFGNAARFNPGFADAHNNLGALLLKENRSEEAIAPIERAVKLKPDYAVAWNNLGGAYGNVGRLDDAAAAFRQAIATNPEYASAFRALSEIETITADDPCVTQMRALHERDGIPREERAQLCFGLAKASEDCGDLEAAFAYLSEGNRVRREVLGYNFGSDIALFGKIKAAEDILGSAAYDGPAAGVTPVFILGMPRSGTTLMERIVSSHSAVEGAGELPYLNQVCPPLVSEGRQLAPGTIDKLRQFYLERLNRHANGKSVVTDKMPHNFRWIGLIARMLPEAKIVHVRRDPRAVCWSNFKHYFATTALGYAYDLDDVVRYHGLYRGLMAFWHKRYPGRIIEVDYDALTADPESSIRDLIGRLGLPWEGACLTSHENTDSVATASREQVRKPIYRGSSDAWRKFEPFIGDAFATLPDELQAPADRPTIHGLT